MKQLPCMFTYYLSGARQPSEGKLTMYIGLTSALVDYKCQWPSNLLYSARLSINQSVEKSLIVS